MFQMQCPSPEGTRVCSGLPGEGQPVRGLKTTGSWGAVKLGMAHCSWVSPQPSPLCQSSSQPLSLGFGSSRTSGPAPRPPWSTPRLSSRTPSQRSTVTCAWCSCWEPGGPLDGPRFLKIPKCLPSASPPVPLTLQIPRGLGKTRRKLPQELFLLPSPSL